MPSTPSTSAGSGVGALTEVAPVTGLLPDTDYTYRIIATNAHGAAVGSWVTFHTAPDITLPTAQTGAATSVSGTGATINATVSANGSTGTQWWFEWGTTKAYGNTTAHVPISGNVLTPVSFHLTGLALNTVYHFRVVAQNADGTTTGSDTAFGFTPPASEPPEVFQPSLLPIDLSVEVQTVDGRIFRWDVDDQDPTKRPQDLRFSTAEGDGFADASCTLARPVGLDWPDLGLLNTVRFVGAQGVVAYEGRVAATPRSVGDAGETFEIDASGWMSSARDRPFTEVYVDRSGNNWKEPSLTLRKRLLAANYPLESNYTHTVDSGSITFKGQKSPGTGGTFGIPLGSQSVVVYYAPSGTQISGFGYLCTEANVGNTEGAKLHGTDNEDRAIADTALAPWEEHLALITNSPDGLPRATGFSTPRAIALLRVEQTTSAGVSANPLARHFEKIAVYGNHSIPTRPNGNDPDGVYASDVFRNIVNRFCPQLDASQIASTSVVIPHLVFDTPTAPFDALTLLNGYHAYLLNAWEGGVIQWEPADLTEPDWLVRKGEPGVTMDLHGESTDQFANGIVVSYQDINQRQRVLYPNDNPQLRDSDPDNQANKAGIQLWTTLDISVPVDQQGALALGATALAEFNRPKWPGTVTISSGYVQDVYENPLPAYRVRCGQTLSIVNLPNDTPRLITATDYSESGELSITLEMPPTRIDAVLARLEPPPGLLG